MDQGAFREIILDVEAQCYPGVKGGFRSFLEYAAAVICWCRYCSKDRGK
jgi:hypothetical protein